MILLTPRLSLAPVTPAEAAALHQMWTSPGGRKFLWDDEVIPREQTEEIIRLSQRYFAQHGTGLWLATKRTTLQAVGYAGFWYFHEPPELELLYGIDETLWGQGYAAEAAGAIVKYGFAQLGFTQIIASADAPNLASFRVMEKLGMKFLRRATTDEKDTIFYGLTRN